MTWQEIQKRVPGFQWAQVAGGFSKKLRRDEVSKGFEAGKRSHTYAMSSGKSALIPLTFPLHLWQEVGAWWQKLSWSPISTMEGQGHSHQVSWLELLVEFELHTGVRCCEANACPMPSWGERAKLLQKVVTQVLKVRGDGLKDLEISTVPRMQS